MSKIQGVIIFSIIELILILLIIFACKSNEDDGVIEVFVKILLFLMFMVFIIGIGFPYF